MSADVEFPGLLQRGAASHSHTCYADVLNISHKTTGAPAAGLCMAELVAEGKAKSANIDAFSPARFFTSRTRRGKKMKGIEVGEQW